MTYTFDSAAQNAASNAAQARQEQQRVDLETIAANTAEIERLVNECKAIAAKGNVCFSLESIDLYTDDEAQNRWENSGC